jgi:hypothetical protein
VALFVGPDARELAPDRLYAATAEPELVRVPRMAFAMIDGQGDPNSAPSYRHAIEALYALSYTLKFALKRELGLVYRVGPLEGLWWTEDMTTFSVGERADWKWTMLIAQPEAVTPERFATVRWDLTRQKELPGLARTRLESFEEGLAAQVLHVGPYSAEGPTIGGLHAFIAAHGLAFDGVRQKHHELYLGDPRRAAPARLRTIIRQPVVAA